MPEQLLFTRILNHAFAGPVDALLHTLRVDVALRALGAQPISPQAPISNAVAMEVLLLVFLLVLFTLFRTRLSVDSPAGLQLAFEGINSFVKGQSRDVIGHGSEPFAPFLATLLLFILVGNLIGLIPGLEAPTGVPVVPLGCAVCVFFYYHAHGFRAHGISYLKQFLGHQDPSLSIWARIPISILMLIIEPISHLARVVSLTVRLYGNMFAGDMVILVFLSLIPIGVPVIFIGLHIFVALIQAYVFFILAAVYLAGAIAEEH